jgi:NADH:ubiquinone oxidoreductase subunit K
MDWKHLALCLVKGGIFGFFVYVISGADASFGLGLLVAYLEYKNFGREIKEIKK